MSERGTDSSLPTGRQFEIRSGDQGAVVTEVGATLRSYRVGGREFLDTFGPEAMSDHSRGQTLLPWPNRIEGGRYEFEGEEYQLPINEVDKDAALHGLVCWSNWNCLEHDEDRVVMGLVLHSQEGYPHVLSLGIEYALSGSGLAVRTTATNIGETSLPFGVGNHPYFTVGTPTVDACKLRVPAGTYFQTDENLIPTGQAGVEGTEYDFREEREIGGTRLDTCFTDVTPDSDGLTRVAFTYPDGDPELTIWMDSENGFIQVFTGDTLPAESRRRGIAIEAMTCAPNAFNTGVGLRVLQPGESLSTTWGVAVT